MTSTDDHAKNDPGLPVASVTPIFGAAPTASVKANARMKRKADDDAVTDLSEEHLVSLTSAADDEDTRATQEFPAQPVPQGAPAVDVAPRTPEAPAKAPATSTAAPASPSKAPVVERTSSPASKAEKAADPVVATVVEKQVAVFPPGVTKEEFYQAVTLFRAASAHDLFNELVEILPNIDDPEMLAAIVAIAQTEKSQEELDELLTETQRQLGGTNARLEDTCQARLMQMKGSDVPDILRQIGAVEADLATHQQTLTQKRQQRDSKQQQIQILEDEMAALDDRSERTTGNLEHKRAEVKKEGVSQHRAKNKWRNSSLLFLGALFAGGFFYLLIMDRIVGQKKMASDATDAGTDTQRVSAGPPAAPPLPAPAEKWVTMAVSPKLLKPDATGVQTVSIPLGSQGTLKALCKTPNTGMSPQGVPQYQCKVITSE